MNSGFSARSSNIPYAFNPGSNRSSTPSNVVAPLNSDAAKDRLIVGVDFGTTYSGRSGMALKDVFDVGGANWHTGVAAVYSATPEDIDIIKTWPGGNGTCYSKGNPPTYSQ